MKRIKGLVFLIPLFFFSFAPKQQEKLVWLGWNEGYEKSMKTKKILLVDAYTDWCGWCKRMDKDTYSNPEVIKKINKYFIPVKFNPELKGVTYKINDQTLTGEQLHSQLAHGESTGFPTVYYIFPNKKSIFLDPGYKDAQAFLQVLDIAIAESK
jgi:thioredoxin-related protein